MIDNIKEYPGVVKAALEISFCNGGINGNRSEEDMMNELDFFIKSTSWGHYASYLRDISDWIQTLTYEQVNLICDGEEQEMDKFLENAPYGTKDILADIFNNVC